MIEDNITVSDLKIMTRANNYRHWIYRQIAPFIGQRILEVGAGIGNFTTLLMDRELVVATDKYPPCIDYLKTRVGNHFKGVLMQLDIANPDRREMDHYKLDTVICLNVLEHIEDDVQALTYMHTVLQPGGRLVLLVPAFPILYGSVDRSLGHYRRYTKGDLIPKIGRAGFEVERAFYMNMIGMVGWFLNNRVLMRREESANQIGFFDRFIAPWAERLERFLRPPFGLSLVAICRKG